MLLSNFSNGSGVLLIDLSITEEQTDQTQLITMALQCHPSPFSKANVAPRILYKRLDLTAR